MSELQPLHLGNSWSIPGEEIGEFVGPDGSRITAVEVPYDHLGEYVFGATIQNGSDFRITVTAVGKMGWGLLEAREFLLEPPSLHGSVRGLEAARPFEPFVLAPDEQRMIWVRSRFNNCARIHSTTHVTSLRFHYTAVGFRRTQEVPLYADINIRGPQADAEEAAPTALCPVVPVRATHPLPGGFDVEVNLAPEYGLIFRGHDGPASGCEITVNGGIRASVSLVEGGSVRIGPRETVGWPATTFVPATAFRGREGAWDPSRDPVETVALSCAEYSGFVPDEPDTIDFSDVDTRPRPLPDVTKRG